MTDYVLQVEDLLCRHEDRTVVDGLSMAVTPGSLACILGPSGCGKTTVLRAIAGFHPLDRGQILLSGQLVSQPGFSVPPERRRIGMVFQDHALFPHLDVQDNIAFGLRGEFGKATTGVVATLLERMGLGQLGSRYPHELSGGQQQRVALARALAPNPDLLLMDEPFSNLDVDLRERLGYEVRDILKAQGATCVLVTHDQHDAFALGDQVGVMTGGKIVQSDTPYNLYHEPVSRFVAGFIGDGVFIRGTLLSKDKVETELGVIIGKRSYDWAQGTSVDVLIRPDDIVLDPASGAPAQVVRKAFKGAEILYTLRLPSGGTVLSLFPSHANYAVGEHVDIRLQADHLVAFQHGS